MHGYFWQDYYDIIHTPMDFGTISRNLQGGIKYVNASDVYSDVEHIWENCLKLYKKGEYIVYLMKLVKKKFMKCWTAAGLDSGQSIKSKGMFYIPSIFSCAILFAVIPPLVSTAFFLANAEKLTLTKLFFDVRTNDWLLWH